MSRLYLHLAINISQCSLLSHLKKRLNQVRKVIPTASATLLTGFIAELHKAQSSSFIASVRMHSYACAPLCPRYATVLATVYVLSKVANAIEG